MDLEGYVKHCNVVLTFNTDGIKSQSVISKPALQGVYSLYFKQIVNAERKFHTARPTNMCKI